MATTLLKVQLDDLEKFGVKLSDLSGEAVGKSIVSALNGAVDGAYELGRERMLSGVNLNDEYLRRRMEVKYATQQKPSASITARGGKAEQTPLSRYPSKMVLAPRKTTGHQLNNKKRPYTGGLNLPEGSRQKAVEVSVSKQGGGTTLLYGFMQPLRGGAAAGGNGFGVFIRDRNGKKVHRYGPAVYQLFKTQIPNIEDEVTDDLEASLLDALENQIQKALA